jgi:hypothetical protein
LTPRRFSSPAAARAARWAVSAIAGRTASARARRPAADREAQGTARAPPAEAAPGHGLERTFCRRRCCHLRSRLQARLRRHRPPARLRRGFRAQLRKPPLPILKLSMRRSRLSGLDANEIGRVWISMMAESNTLRSKVRI